MEKLTTKQFGTKKWLKFCAMVKDVLNYGVFLSQPTRTLASSKYSLIKIT